MSELEILQALRIMLWAIIVFVLALVAHTFFAAAPAPTRTPPTTLSPSAIG